MNHELFVNHMLNIIFVNQIYHRVKRVQIVSWWSWNNRLKYHYFSKKKIKISRSGAVRLPFGQNEALVTRCRGWVRVLLCITCRCRKVTLCPHQSDFDGSNRAYTMQKKLNTIRIHHVGVQSSRSDSRWRLRISSTTTLWCTNYFSLFLPEKKSVSSAI